MMAFHAWDYPTGESDALLADLLDEATNETDDLLAELLGEELPSPFEELHLQPPLTATTTPPSFVAEPTTAQQTIVNAPENKIRQPRPSTAIHKSVSATTTTTTTTATITRTEKAKHTLNGLRAEVNQLTKELKRLRKQSCYYGGAHSNGYSALETATVERQKRRRAEQDCRQLRAAVYGQALFIRSLRTVFTNLTPPPLCEGLNLSQYLHDYVRLPRDRSTRRSEYESLSRDERLSLAIEILSRETDAVVFDAQTPYIHTEFLPSSDGFAVTTLSVYAVETRDISAVLRGACVAVRDIVARWPQCEPLDVTRQIVDADEAVAVDHHLLYRLVSAKHKHTRSGAELSVQARATTFYRLRDDDAVMIWDFVDEDELYPIAADTADLTRKSIGALLMRRESGGDGGEERIVCRSICTKRYTANSTRSSRVLDQFVDAARESLRPNGRVFYEIVTQQVAEEEALMANLS